MSAIEVLPRDPAALAHADDPAAVMVALVDQAKTLLAQATGMEGLADVIEWKSRAEAIRVYTQQKDMGHEAELSAAEIVRRAERRIGELIREGQAVGEIRSKEVPAPRPTAPYTRRDGTVVSAPASSGSREQHVMPSPSDFAAKNELSHAIYPMTDDVSDEDFERAIAEAKAEGNLSRNNVVRKVKPTTADRIRKAAMENPAEAPRNAPLKERADQIRALAAKNYTSPQIADEIGVSPDRVRELARRADIEIPADAVFGGRFRKVDPNRVIGTIVENAIPEASALALVAYSELDRDRLEEWANSLGVAIRSLTTIRKSIQRELAR